MQNVRTSLLAVGHAILGLASGAPTPADAQNATAFSILYGYPLASYVDAVEPIIQSVGVNALDNNRYLETASSEGTANQVVDPNTDTIYSAMVFDLSKQDVAVTVPHVPKDWFALWSYYDPFGDNFVNIGPENFDGAGTYLLRHDPNKTSYGVTPTNKSDGYVAYIDSPTTFGIMDIRWLVYNESSYSRIHTWQNETTIKTVPKPPSQCQNISLLDVLASVPKTTKSPTRHLLQLLAKFAPWCPPLVVSDRPRVNSMLSKAGISNNAFTPPGGVNYTLANLTALTFADDAIQSPGVYFNRTNGWVVLNPKDVGNYDTNYGIRTSVAITGYLGLTSPSAVYPTFNNGTAAGGLSAATAFQLGANESLLYSFSGRPPLEVTGFWSLSAYENHYLIPNALNRSSLGDRSNITFPNGQLVYHDGGQPTSHPNGEFQILVQPADVEPPANWTSNWVPAPAGGTSELSVLLRWYDAVDEPLVHGSYVYPTVVRGAAIT